MLQVGESSLYPALQRLLLNGWVSAEWGASENNRRARYYTLTADGRKRLAAERKEFQRMVGAIQQSSNRVGRYAVLPASRPGTVAAASGSSPTSPRNWKRTACCLPTD